MQVKAITSSSSKSRIPPHLNHIWQANEDPWSFADQAANFSTQMNSIDALIKQANNNEIHCLLSDHMENWSKDSTLLHKLCHRVGHTTKTEWNNHRQSTIELTEQWHKSEAPRCTPIIVIPNQLSWTSHKCKFHQPSSSLRQCDWEEFGPMWGLMLSFKKPAWGA